MSGTCSLFPPFGDPWPSCLLPSHIHCMDFISDVSWWGMPGGCLGNWLVVVDTLPNHASRSCKMIWKTFRKRQVSWKPKHPFRGWKFPSFLLPPLGRGAGSWDRDSSAMATNSIIMIIENIHKNSYLFGFRENAGLVITCTHYFIILSGDWILDGDWLLCWCAVSSRRFLFTRKNSIMPILFNGQGCVGLCGAV